MPSSESAGNQKKMPPDIHAIILNDIVMQYCTVANYHYVHVCIHVTYGKVFGETPNILMFWLFPENGGYFEANC